MIATDVLSQGNIIVGTVVGIGLLAYVFGQWRNGKVKAMEVTLAAYEAELALQRAKSERLEKELNAERAQSQQRAEQIAALTAKVETLSLLVTAQVPQSVLETVEEAMGKNTAIIIEAIRSNQS